MKIARLFIICLCCALINGHALAVVRITVGAERFDQYLPKLANKRVALVINQTAVVGDYHAEHLLLDTLKSQGINIVKIFSPEHGFRGTADAGEDVNSGKDALTGIAVTSLYGAKKKPTAEDLKGVDVVVFDIQDVGVRFFTYISTLHYVMEACAENRVPMIVLDRPNPNGFYVDGPVLKPAFKSFVGIDPVPIVYGMTIGEYANMVNGEHWLDSSLTCNLTVVPCINYNHETLYHLPHKPSPNLPNLTSIYLYPSLCLFEGTIVSIGRGTSEPFQVFGHPDIKNAKYSFTPVSMPGAKEPLYMGKTCFGVNLEGTEPSFFLNKREINLGFLLLAHRLLKDNKTPFFNDYFEKLVGNDELRKQIEKGMSEELIRQTWQPDLIKFKAIRAKYLLYKDFNFH